MKRNSGNFKAVEVWEIKNDKRDPKVTSDRIQVTKIAVRNSKGQFLGPTNYRDKN